MTTFRGSANAPGNLASDRIEQSARTPCGCFPGGFGTRCVASVPTPARACLGDPPDPSQEDRTTATDANAAAPMIAAPARTLMPQQYASGEGFPNQQTEPSSSSGPIPSIHRSGADHATPVSRVGPMRAHSSPAGDALGNDQETYARAAWRVLLSRDSERASKGSAHARAGTRPSMSIACAILAAMWRWPSYRSMCSP
jgi:hypothetical protein